MKKSITCITVMLLLFLCSALSVQASANRRSEIRNILNVDYEISTTEIYRAAWWTEGYLRWQTVELSQPLDLSRFNVTLITGIYSTEIGDVLIVTEPCGRRHLMIDLGEYHYGEYIFTGFHSIDVDVELNPIESINYNLYTSTNLIDCYHPDIIAKAEYIVNNLPRNQRSEYDIARAIHIWVAGNVWVDRDLNYRAFYHDIFTQEEIFPLASVVLYNRHTVCGGYAILTVALMRAAGLEANVVIGCGYWLYSGYPVGHAWYHVYADGRWLVGDSMWDSGNYFQNGQFSEPQPISNNWFDVTDYDIYGSIIRVQNWYIF